MKKLFLLVSAICWLQTMYGQNEICYTYDAAGNRTKRQLCCTNCLNGPHSGDRQQASSEAAGKLLLVPNPTTGLFRLESAGVPENAQLLILDMAGKVLISRQFGDGQIDLSAFPPGTYIVNLKYADIRKSALIEKTNP